MSDTRQQEPTLMRAVTISREYGSGGGEIAARLAKRLGWRLVDHEVVLQVARAVGVSEAEAAEYDEHTDNLVARVLYSLNAIQAPVSPAVPMLLTTDSRAFGVAVRKVVEQAVEAGQSVIVGRGGQVLLHDRREVLHARIVAPLEQRLAYVMQRESLNHAEAQARIRAKDSDRARFVSAAFHGHPSDSLLYDLVINTGVLDLDSAVDLLTLALERKATRLSVPAEQLGPGAGLPTYPEPPSNFVVPATTDVPVSTQVPKAPDA